MHIITYENKQSKSYSWCYMWKINLRDKKDLCFWLDNDEYRKHNEINWLKTSFLNYMASK